MELGGEIGRQTIDEEIRYALWRNVNMKCIVLTVLLLISCNVSVVLATQDTRIPPVQALDNVAPKSEIIKNSSYSKPAVIRSAKEAGEYFSEDELAKVLRQTDFEEQFILAFAWRGSSRDKLEYSVLESFPEQVVFSYRPGRTRDLRLHTLVLALRSNVKWRMKDAKADRPQKESDEYIKVEVKGKLNSQVFAIGGETTGFVIKSGDVSWELDFASEPDLRAKAKELHEKSVIVKGELKVKAGVEIRQRWIVTVHSLSSAVDVDTDDGEYLSTDGDLRQALIVRDSQTGFAGETGHVWTIEPDGSWRHQTFLNEMIREPEQQGKFSRRQLQDLARQLKKYDLLGLPMKIGDSPDVNPHVVSLSFGEKEAALISLGGSPLPPFDSTRADEPEQRFAALIRFLHQRMDFNSVD